MTEAVFQTTGQALHVSFLIMSVEPRQKNSLRQALIQIIEAVELPSARLKAWLQQLRGEGGGTVNFAGLTSDEIRAQCAMVTQIVEDHLPGPERDVIWARYGYQTYRAKGVQGLAAYLRPQLNIGDDIAIKAVIYGHFSPEQRKRGLSFKDISDERGIHTRTLRRVGQIVSGSAEILERMAIERLAPMFRRDGLVEWEDHEMEIPYKSSCHLASQAL